MHRYLIFAIGLLVLVVILAPSLDNLPGATAGPAAPVAVGVGLPIVASPGPPSVAGAAPAGGGMTIDRDPGGQFHVQAMVNDQPVRLLIDTGADGLALSEADARTIGIAPDPDSYRAVVTTASGTAYGAHVRIDRLEVAGHDLGGVDAVVVRGLGTSLLGQSVLRRLGPVNLSGDRLLIGN